MQGRVPEQCGEHDLFPQGDSAVLTRGAWTSARRFRLAVALAFALALTAIAAWHLDTDRHGLLGRGDFPAFYAAAILAESGSGAVLYSLEMQQSLENAWWPSLGGSFHVFAYPPQYALALLPLSLAAPSEAKLIWLVLMLGCLMMTVRALHSTRPTTRNWFIEAVQLLIFPPLFVGLAAGQNTPLSLLLLTGTSALLLRQRNFTAGFVAGCWLVKPQFGLLAAPAFCAAANHRRRFAAGFGLSLAAQLFVATSWFGPYIFSDWLRTMRSLGAMNAGTAENQRLLISLPGVIQRLAALTTHDGNVGTKLGAALGICLLVAGFRRIAQLKRQSQQRALLLIGPLVAAASPQTAYYDLGFAVLPVFGWFVSGSTNGINRTWLVWLLSGALQLFIRASPVPTLGAVTGFFLVYAWCNRQGVSPALPPDQP